MCIMYVCLCIVMYACCTLFAHCYVVCISTFYDFSTSRSALQDISNISDATWKEPVSDTENSCVEIASPSVFGIFDLRVNQDLNQRAIVQYSAKVKVSFKALFSSCGFLSLDFAVYNC